jgi:hypothetical protein
VSEPDPTTSSNAGDTGDGAEGPTEPALAPIVDHQLLLRNAALDRAISTPRYTSYLTAARNDPDLARDLYVWDRNLAVAVLADLAIVEVGLRNAMHDALSAQWGPAWYQHPDVALDDRSRSQLATAWGHLPKPVQQRPGDADVPGRLVAQCMLGFWVNLLDAGDHFGRDPRRFKVDYEDIWRDALSKAFPGGRTEARNDRNIHKIPDAAFTRAWTHSIAKNVVVLRNRVAHHEPLHKGFPLPGQKPGNQGAKKSRRMTAAEGHAQYLKLARMVDRNLADWITHDTKVPTILANRPC